MKHGKLVIIRHGESRMNELNLFTGWIDISLSKAGIDEAHSVADHCQQFDYDAAFTSHLERAHETLLIILSHQRRIGMFQHDDNPRYTRMKNAPQEFTQNTIPIFMDQNLNERYYGDLQGLNKHLAEKTFGKDLITQWRRGYSDRPPNGESLQDVYNRVVPYFQKNIHPRIRAGKAVLIVAHGNTLRAIIKFLERIPDAQIPYVNLPTAQPLVYSCINDIFNRTEGEYQFNRTLR